MMKIEEKLGETLEEAERRVKWTWDDFVDHLGIWFHFNVPPDWHKRLSLAGFMVVGLVWVGIIARLAYLDLAPYFASFIQALKSGSTSLIHWPMMFLFWLGLASPGVILFFLGWRLIKALDEY
ncbi:hypothetical protein D6789_04425 [Candidatus Woesearchaeota archaeon]|nr:MAG: hypothetical protein D6789_04425 [Candidatus Woesearchaeota archaeon]